MNNHKKKQNHIDTTKKIILKYLNHIDCQIFLFGSQLKKTIKRPVDIDIAIMPLKKFPVGLLSEIREALEESTIPYNVDLIDLSLADSQFIEQVKRTGIQWK